MDNQTPIDVAITKQGEIAILTMSGSDNRLNPIFVKKWLKALDHVESWPDVKALVTTGSGKFYCNGIDLKYLSTASSEEREKFAMELLAFRRRILFFPVVTIAAINGHCFAGGMFLALLHDYRVMHNGKGWLCMNEMDIGVQLPPSFVTLIKEKFTPNLIREVAVYGNRYPAAKALDIGLIDRVSEEGQVVPTAVEYARSLVKGRTYSRQMLSQMKEDVYGHIIFDDSRKPTSKL